MVLGIASNYGIVTFLGEQDEIAGATCYVRRRRTAGSREW
jgi:hypothetical protein